MERIISNLFLNKKCDAYKAVEKFNNAVIRFQMWHAGWARVWH